MFEWPNVILAKRTKLIKLISDYFPTDGSMNSDQLNEEMMTRIVFEWFNFASVDETEADADGVGNHCDKTFHIVNV